MTTRPKFDPVARIAAAGLALLAAASVLLQLYLSTGELGGLGAALWMLGRFFTVLTNTLVAITFGLLAMRYRVSSRWLLALTAAIAGVGIVYHALLAELNPQAGLWLLADHGLHSAVPLASVAWFALFMHGRGLRWSHALLAVVWPVIYCCYALVRGSLDGTYPYPFIDAGALSAGQLAANIAGLSTFFLALGATLVLVLRMRARLSRR